MTRTTRTVLTSLLVGGLLLAGIGLAHGRGGAGGPAGARPGLAGPTAMRGLPALPMLAGLPIGTTVEAAFHDADPASGAAPVTTITITVGVDSETAFGEAFAEARAAAAEWETSYLVVATSEIRRTIDLPETDAAVTPGRAWAATPLRLPLAGLEDGDTITVELYDADRAEGGELLETLGFTLGVDSAIGFRAAVEDALEGASVAVVTSSPRSMTVDLAAAPERAAGAAARMGPNTERMGRMAERMGAMAERFGDAAERWDGPPTAPGMRGRR